MRRRRGSQWLLCWLALGAQCSTAVQKANGARSDCQSPMLLYEAIRTANCFQKRPLSFSLLAFLQL